MTFFLLDLAKFLKVPNFPRKSAEFLCDVIERAYKERQRTGIKRDDIIDVCLEEMQRSVHWEEFKVDKEHILYANMVMYMFAGFDTQAISISQILHNLVKNPHCQDKIMEELDEAYEATNGEITYDMIESLKYLDMVFKESLRYLSPTKQQSSIFFSCVRYKSLFVSHERVCTKDYKLPGTDIVIPKGRVTHVYFNDIVHDENNWVNPHQFDPMNFHPDNFKNKFAYMSFGQGPRACPGTRYAYLAVKIFLAKLFRSYRVVPSEKTNMGDAVVRIVTENKLTKYDHENIFSLTLT